MLDPSRPGRAFDGLGGNFRLQNPDIDPAVIRYNLENMRVAWGRVEMPWRSWHPDENVDPLAEARDDARGGRPRGGRLLPRGRERRGRTCRGSPPIRPRWSGSSSTDRRLADQPISPASSHQSSSLAPLELAGWIEADPDAELLYPVPFATVCFRLCPRRYAGRDDEASVAAVDALNEAVMNRINDSVVQEDRPEIRGMVATVPHLVTVEEV